MNTLPSAPQPDIELRTIIAILRRQFRVIAYCFVGVFSLAAIFLFVATPRYSATALLIVDPDPKGIMDTASARAGTTGSENARVDSEAEILRSDAVALPVVMALDLTKDPEFAPGEPLAEKMARLVGVAHASTPPDRIFVSKTLARLKDSVSISRRGLTYLLGVTVTSQSGEKAAELANAIAQTYLEQQIQSKSRAALMARDMLVAQVEEARSTLETQEMAFDDFIERNLDKVIQRDPSSTLLETTNQLADEQSTLAEKSFRQGELQFLLAQADWGQVGTVLQDPEIQALGERREDLLATAGNDKAALPSNLAATLAQIDAQLESRAKTEIQELADSIAQLENSTISLRGQVRDQVLGSELPADMLTELYAIRQESSSAQNQFSTLISRIHDLETQAQIEVADSRIVSPALAPISPGFPNKPLVLLVALAASLGLGVSAAFLKQYYVGGFTSDVQLADLMQVPGATAIPQVSAMPALDTSIPDLIIDSPLSPYSEALRKLRAAIDQNLGGLTIEMDAGVRNGKVILVTSAVAGEGKTTTALSLARTYAAAGQKTLLIDGDLRRPAIHRLLGFAPKTGFVDYLRAPNQVEQSKTFYARDPASDLAVILGAGRSEVATDQLLTSKTFGSLLAQAREVYDVTIIDSPPLLPVVDARYIAPQVDAVVVAVKWASTNQGDLRSAVGPLRAAMKDGTPLIPVLTQTANGHASLEYGGYYGSYSAAT